MVNLDSIICEVTHQFPGGPRAMAGRRIIDRILRVAQPPDWLQQWWQGRPLSPSPLLAGGWGRRDQIENCMIDWLVIGRRDAQHTVVKMSR